MVDKATKLLEKGIFDEAYITCSPNSPTVSSNSSFHRAYTDSNAYGIFFLGMEK